MTQIETVEIVDEWLYHVLSTDGPLTEMVGIGSISGTLSSTELTAPYVTFLCQSSVDVRGVGGVRISTDNLYEVKAVAQSGSWDDVRPIASRIGELIDLPNTTVTRPGGQLVCVRERIISYPEVDEGLQYRHLGGVYRIRASRDE